MENFHLDHTEDIQNKENQNKDYLNKQTKQNVSFEKINEVNSKGKQIEQGSQEQKQYKYDFDTIIERRGTNCMKYDQLSMFPLYQGKENETDSMWIADIDFAVCPEIQEELKKRCDHPIFGYPTELKDEELLESIHSWFTRRHNMKFNKEDITYSVGSLCMISGLIQILTQPGEGIIVFTPVYYQFIARALQNKRKISASKLKLIENKYEIDFDEVEELMSDKQNRILILANPHNPSGRVWTRTEMQKISELCVKYNIFLISDEIFSDLTFAKYTHTSPLSLDYQPIHDLCAVLATPSKCFGLAGLTSSVAIIKNKSIKTAYVEQIQAWGLYFLNIFGQVAIKTAYQKGEDWVNETRDYIESNTILVKEFFEKNNKRIKVVETQAAYLVIISFEELGLTQDELKIKLANVNLLPTFTTDFYQPKEYKPEIRLNVGCSKIIVQKALENILKAVV